MFSKNAEAATKNDNSVSVKNVTEATGIIRSVAVVNAESNNHSKPTEEENIKKVQQSNVGLVNQTF